MVAGPSPMDGAAAATETTTACVSAGMRADAARRPEMADNFRPKAYEIPSWAIALALYKQAQAQRSK